MACMGRSKELELEGCGAELDRSSIACMTHAAAGRQHAEGPTQRLQQDGHAYALQDVTWVLQTLAASAGRRALGAGRVDEGLLRPGRGDGVRAAAG